MRRWVRGLLGLNAVLVAGAAACGVVGLAWGAGAEEAAQAGEAAAATSKASYAFFAAALSTGLAALGAAYAVAHVGAASVGAMTEKPEIAGRTLIVIGLAEGIAIYGLIISVLILGRV